MHFPVRAQAWHPLSRVWDQVLLPHPGPSSCAVGCGSFLSAGSCPWDIVGSLWPPGCPFPTRSSGPRGWQGCQLVGGGGAGPRAQAADTSRFSSRRLVPSVEGPLGCALVLLICCLLKWI